MCFKEHDVFVKFVNRSFLMHITRRYQSPGTHKFTAKILLSEREVAPCSAFRFDELLVYTARRF